MLLKLTVPTMSWNRCEISAQPPGKSCKISPSLSTGEKVLTALSLLFAILKHKPAPFYLLDGSNRPLTRQPDPVCQVF